MLIKLTKTAIDAAQPGDLLWDSAVAGFGLRVSAKGQKKYYLKYRVGKKQRWYAFAKHGTARSLRGNESGPATWTVDAARREAMRLIGRISEGADPSNERSEQRKARTVTEFFHAKDGYDELHIKVEKKASSAQEDYRNFRLHIEPRFGNLRIKDLRQEDIAKLKAEMTKTRPAFNRVRALISHMCRCAEMWGGERPPNSNPCTLVSPYKEYPRKRRLDDKELADLGRVLSEVEKNGEINPTVVALSRLLVFTGCRLSEILTAKWEYFDFDAQLLCLPDSKNNEPKKVALGAPALEVIATLPRLEGNPYILTGKKPGSHFVGCQKPWARIRKMAGLVDFRFHDLRHSYASVGRGRGADPHLIGQLLGHKDLKSSARYAHLNDNPRLVAAEGISSEIAAKMNGNTGEVIPLKRKKRRKK